MHQQHLHKKKKWEASEQQIFDKCHNVVSEMKEAIISHMFTCQWKVEKVWQKKKDSFVTCDGHFFFLTQDKQCSQEIYK